LFSAGVGAGTAGRVETARARRRFGPDGLRASVGPTPSCSSPDRGAEKIAGGRWRGRDKPPARAPHVHPAAGRPRPTRARATVRAHVEAARYLSGGALPEHRRQDLEDHFDGLEATLAAELPSLVDADGSLHTPDVRLAVVMLPSGSVGRVRVLSRHGAPLDRQIAQRLSLGVSNHAGMSVDGSEVEVIVRLRPQMFYTRYRGRPVPRPCCAELDDED
jgi:hypothetical protein